MTWEEEELEVLISYLKQETESKTPRHVRSMMYKYLIARQLIHRFNLMYNFLPQVILDKFKEFYAKRTKMVNENEDNVIVNVKAEKENGDDNKKLSALDKIINMVA